MTTSVQPDADRSRDLGDGEAVRKRTLAVIGRLSDRSPSAVAGRAQLRSAIAKDPGSDPAIWAYTLEEGPERLLGDDPTRGERAVHVALTLWALHQGSHPTPMHLATRRASTIGGSVRRLAVAAGAERPEEHSSYKRLCAMIAAPTFAALSVHARGLVALLSSSDIPMDYGRFAADLYEWQDPERRSRVIRQWGRDFARTPRDDDPKSD